MNKPKVGESIYFFHNDGWLIQAAVRDTAENFFRVVGMTESVTYCLDYSDHNQHWFFTKEEAVEFAIRNQFEKSKEHENQILLLRNMKQN